MKLPCWACRSRGTSFQAGRCFERHIWDHPGFILTLNLSVGVNEECGVNDSAIFLSPPTHFLFG